MGLETHRHPLKLTSVWRQHPGGDISVDIGRDEEESLSKLREAHEPRDGFRIVVFLHLDGRARGGKWG